MRWCGPFACSLLVAGCGDGSGPGGDRFDRLAGTYTIRTVKPYQYPAQPCTVRIGDPEGNCITDTFAIAVVRGSVTLGEPGPAARLAAGSADDRRRASYALALDLEAVVYRSSTCSSRPFSCWETAGEASAAAVVGGAQVEGFEARDSLFFTAPLNFDPPEEGIGARAADVVFRAPADGPFAYYDSTRFGVVEVAKE
jgi:hypothetical protein